MSGRAPAAAIAPRSDADSSAFWDALRTGTLMVPRCPNGHRFFPPAPGCAVCGARGSVLAPVSGRAKAYTWARVHIALHPAFADETPYTVVVGELEEGGRLLGRLLDEPASLQSGAALRFEPYEVGGEVLPGFRLVDRDGDHGDGRVPRSRNGRSNVDGPVKATTQRREAP